MNKYLKIFFSVLLGILFLWLAFREVPFGELVDEAKEISFLWIVPFTMLTLFSHYVRAIRWKMLFSREEKRPSSLTLYTGVMFGYLTNIVLPRVGELTRPVYVARQTDKSNSKLIGTIVLERVIDVLSMLLLMVFVAIFVISDTNVLNRLFGFDETTFNALGEWIIPVMILVVALVAGYILFRRLFAFLGEKNDKVKAFTLKIRETVKTFVDGLLAVRELKNWPLFIFYTLLIWACYILMTYVGFWMLDLHTDFDLGIKEALVLTMVSAVGISIPTPGGIGTYHLFITQALVILYGVPEATGLTYATIAHAATLLIVIVSSPILLALDKWYHLKKDENPSESIKRQ